MQHTVELAAVTARPTVVVRASTTWQAFPTLWRELLDEVWTCVRAAELSAGCPNVMLYRDDVPNVEVGVELARQIPLHGRVVTSELPAGPVAMTVHRGPYAALGTAHEAVAQWCSAQDRRRAGPRWEIYGPHRDDPAELETSVYHLLD